MTRKAIINKIQSNIKDWLVSVGHNFEGKEFGDFVKETDKYIDTIFVSVEGTKSSGMILGNISTFSRKIKLIENFWEEYKKIPLKISGGIPCTFSGNLMGDFLFDERGRPKSIANWANWREAEPDMVERICEKVKTDYYTLVLPKLDEYSNIHKLDAIANGEDRTFSLGNEVIFRRLIISKLAGNSKYEQSYEELLHRFKNGIIQYPENEKYKNYLFVIEQLYEKLKNVQPLENPILI
jgi:hypothetical protein